MMGYPDIRPKSRTAVNFRIGDDAPVGARTFPQPVGRTAGAQVSPHHRRLHAHVDYFRVAYDSFRMQYGEYEQTV